MKNGEIGKEISKELDQVKASLRAIKKVVIDPIKLTYFHNRIEWTYKLYDFVYLFNNNLKRQDLEALPYLEMECKEGFYAAHLSAISYMDSDHDQHMDQDYPIIRFSDFIIEELGYAPNEFCDKIDYLPLKSMYEICDKIIKHFEDTDYSDREKYLGVTITDRYEN